MASLWPPKKNASFTLCFTLYKNDGTVVANPGTYTKKGSIDGGAVADISASVTEEDTTYGQLSLVLSAAEMNGDWIWVYVTDDTAGTVPFTCTLYTVANTQDELKTAIPDQVWDEALADHTTAGTAGKALGDAGGISAPTAAAIADAVWDEATAGHAAAGSTGKALTDSAAQGDPWSTAVPGAYGAGTAGKILGDNLNATVSSRSTLTAQQVWEYATRTLTAFGTLAADVWASATRTLSAFGFSVSLDLTQAVPTANTAQTVGDALNAARAQGFGKWAFTGNTLTLYAPDDVTPVKTFTLDDPATPTVRA